MKRGCLVVNVTQCHKGHVSVTYANSKLLSDAGVIFGSDMTTEAALTKVAYVLGKKDWDLHTKRHILSCHPFTVIGTDLHIFRLMLSRNLRGTPRGE